MAGGPHWAALRELILANWPVAARSLAAVNMARGGDPGDVDAFTDLIIMSATPETAVALIDDGLRDVLPDLLGRVAVPTLVLHRRHGGGGAGVYR